MMLGAALTLSIFPGSTAFAKDVPVTGILLFQSGGTASYALVSNVLLNGKTELRGCGAARQIDKSSYKALAKIPLTTVRSLERLADGTVVAVLGEASPVCVVPSNFKYEKDEVLSPSQLFDRSSFQATVLSSDPSGTASMPPFAAGSKLVFGSADDPELAGFLRAERASSLAVWEAYQAKYPASRHLAEENKYVAGLLLKDGQEQLAKYRASAKTGPAYPALKVAKQRADGALARVQADPAALQLRDAVRAELVAIVEVANGKLLAYTKALANHDAGYINLTEAEALSQQVTAIDPQLPAGATCAHNVAIQAEGFERAVKRAADLNGSQQMDEAYAVILPYRSFAGEEPRLKKIVDDAYTLHLGKGTEAAHGNNWTAAVPEFERACEITPGAGCQEPLTKARAALSAATDRVAADDAVARSLEYTTAKDPIHAYEVLANLTPTRKALVQEQMTALEPAYVRAASDRARELEKAHTPMRGRADEDAVREAYAFLEKAAKLSDDPDLKLRIDLLSETVSSYYVAVAQRYIAKPLASEVPLAWAYLREAEQYRPNLEPVRDERTKARAAYQMRGHLSIGVLFLDGTSRRDSAGFAEMLQDAIATGLETSGLPVKVIRPANLPQGTTEMSPNFNLVGEISEHRPLKKTQPETLTSKFRSGERELPNDAWNRADQTYEAAVLQAQRAQSNLTAAQIKNNKKQIEEATGNLTEADKMVQEARARLNVIPKTIQEDVIRPYNYTKETIELTNVVDLSFRVLDTTRSNMILSSDANHEERAEEVHRDEEHQP